jgi:U3 small nucleolar RNA-associated protein 6
LQAFDLCSDSISELQQLQQLLLSTITRAAVKGPPQGGLGAAAAACLQLSWRLQGADAARDLWKKLLLLPPAGGDMFAAMVQLESSAASHASKQQQQQQQEQEGAAAAVVALPADALQRVRAVYDAWVAAYGSSDVELWVQYALFEQGQGRQGPGRVYWRAVKALEEPDKFIQQYRSQVGLV